MRTRVTLDPDVERLLKDFMTARGISFREAVNQAIRAGLIQGNRKDARPFVQRTFSLGVEQDFRWDKALSVAQGMEDDEFNRKLSFGK